MDSLAHSAAIFKYHREMIRLHGNKSSYALGWRDTESQLVRFKALSGIADPGNSSVLDAGCGHADLLPYLTNLFSNITYTGIEQLPELLDLAMERYAGWPRANFIQGNFTIMNLPCADYVFANGSLNYRSADPEYIYKAIRRLYESCRIGFAFNLLSKIIANGLLVSYDAEQILNYCKSICPNVKLIDDYVDEDFTIYMYR